MEMWTKRDIHSGAPVDLDDNKLISMKQQERIRNHLPSAKFKARGKTTVNLPQW